MSIVMIYWFSLLLNTNMFKLYNPFKQYHTSGTLILGTLILVVMCVVLAVYLAIHYPYLLLVVLVALVIYPVYYTIRYIFTGRDPHAKKSH